MSIGKDLADLVQQAGKDAGLDLRTSAADVAAYAEKRVAHLRLAVGEPGFDRALKAEADNVLMYALEKSIDSADANDARLWGLIAGALSIAATLA